MLHGGHAGGGIGTLVSPALAGAVRQAASKTVPDLEWDRLHTLPPAQCAARVLGVTSNSAGYSALFFSNRAGASVGHSLTALCVDWEILPHREAIRQDSEPLVEAVRSSGKNLSDLAKRWSFESLDRKLTSATAQACGCTAPLKLWAYANLWPRNLAERVKSELLKEIYDDEGQVDHGCELLAWTNLTQAGKGLTNSEREAIETHYPRWTAACARVLERVIQARQEYQSLTDPKLSVVGLMEEWSTLHSHAGHGGRGKVTSLLERERKLYVKLSEHPDGTQLTWVTRKACYLSILKAFPRVKRNGESFVLLFQAIKKSQSYEEVMDSLSHHAYKAGYKDPNDLLGTWDTDRGKEQGREHGRTHRGRDNKDEEIPRPSLRKHSDRPAGPRQVQSSLLPRDKRPFPKNGKDEHGRPRKKLRLTAADHAKANGVPEKLANERLAKGQCAICGSIEHYARSCPKNKSTKEHDHPKNAEGNSQPKPTEETVLLTLGRAEVLAGTVEVSSPSTGTDHTDSPTHVRAGFDTMCSQNLVTRSVIRTLGIHPSAGQSVQLQTAGGVREAAEWVQLVVRRPSFRVQLPFLVVDTLPGVDLLVRKADLLHLGYQIVDHAPREEPSDPVNRAKKALMDMIDVWVPLPGAPKYRARLRRIREDEHRDDPRQVYIFEIDWDEGVLEGRRLTEYKSFSRRADHDYSIPMLRQLSASEKDDYEKELKGMIDKQWWREGEPSKDAKPLDLPCCTFPLSQGSHKSTRVRLCSDMRGPNLCLPVASYSGHSVPEVLGILRSRVKPTDHLELLDLQKAFYKLRLARKRCVRIKTAGRSFHCDRIVFGIRCGPAALAAQVTLLLNSAYSGLLGRSVSRRDTREFLDMQCGVSAVPYYDDIALFGDHDRVVALREIIVEIAPLMGAACPAEKRDSVPVPDAHSPPTEPIRHMGVFWSRAYDGRLLLRCVPHEGLDSPNYLSISRREAFSLAGVQYDGVLCHPACRAVSDHLRRWAGRSPAMNGRPQSRQTWDHQWPLSKLAQSRLRMVLGVARAADYGRCEHSSVPPHHDCIVAHCDASERGFGILLHSTSTATRGTWQSLSMDDKVLLEGHAGAFDASLQRTHINRKEYLTVLKCLNAIVKWLDWSPIERQQFRTVIIFCDNASAVKWASTDKFNGSIYDQAFIARAAEAMARHRHDLHDRGIDLDISYIKGRENNIADSLSRLAADLPDLPPLGGGDPRPCEEGKQPGSVRREAAIVLCVLDDNSCIERCGHGAHLAYKPCGSARAGDPLEGVLLEDDLDCSEILDSLERPVALVAQSGGTKFEDTRDLANMTPEQVISLEKEAIRDEGFCDRTTISGVPLKELILALQDKLPKQAANHGANALAAGGAHGPYFRFDEQQGVLEHRDPLLHDSWKVYLNTERARHWAIYRCHTHPLLAAHQGAPRACEALWKMGFSWDSLVSDLRRAVTSCHECQMGKAFAKEPAQPLVRKRNAGRFEKVQLDFLTKPNDARLGGIPETAPGGWQHLCVVIDEGTKVAAAFPTSSTGTRDVIMALLQWCAAYGVPSILQVDMAGAHQSKELSMFLRLMGIELRPGVPRRAQSQGVVERLIRDIKATILTTQADCNGYATPWWASALVSVMVHNNSPLLDTHLSPHELTTGALSPGLVSLPHCITEETELNETWSHLHRAVTTAYELLTKVRNEKQLAAEKMSVVSCGESRVFEEGDKVRLYRIIDGRRCTEGPYEIDHRDAGNCYLYHLKGRKFPAPLSHLLPYYEDDQEQRRQAETGPHRAHISSILRGLMPEGIPVSDLQPGHWIVFRKLTTVDGGKTTCYLAEIIKKEGNKFTVASLDRGKTDRWVIPRSDDTEETISGEDILGRQGFSPTKGRRIPPKVAKWLESHGLANVRR